MADTPWQHDLALCKHTVGARVTAFALGFDSTRQLEEAPLSELNQLRIASLADVLRTLQTRHDQDANWTRAWLMAPSFGDGSLSAVEMLHSPDQTDWQTVVRAARSYVS